MVLMRGFSAENVPWGHDFRPNMFVQQRRLGLTWLSIFGRKSMGIFGRTWPGPSWLVFVRCFVVRCAFGSTCFDVLSVKLKR